MELKSSDEILNEIIAQVEKIYGWTTYRAEPNHFGYANLKWKLHTDAGIRFVKQYNAVRYSDQLLHSVETALGLQDRLHQIGIPCPKIFSDQGRYIQRTPSCERFMVTNYCDGYMVNPGEVNVDQMYDLGQITGRLHQWLRLYAPSNFPLHWQPESKASTLATWEKNWNDAHTVGANKYISALKTQRKIIDGFNLNTFQSCEEGWVHWDLFVDNILFHSNQVSAILDFDRMHYIYPEFDISRAILSGAILENNINVESTKAFVVGYRESSPLTVAKLIRSIQLTWWKEASWLSIKSEEHRTLRRFAHELMWVSDNWFALEEIFNEI